MVDSTGDVGGDRTDISDPDARMRLADTDKMRRTEKAAATRRRFVFPRGA